MTPWQEVDSEIFKKIFEHYWNNNPDTVLEIQNITGLINKSNDNRFFIGSISSLNPTNDKWIKWNIAGLRYLSVSLKTNYTDYVNSCNLGICILEDGPRIAPFGNFSNQYDLVLKQIFNYVENENSTDDLRQSLYQYWYTRDDSGNIIKPNFSKIPLDRLYRVRTYQLSEWEFYVTDYINNNFVFSDKLKGDDLKLC